MILRKYKIFIGIKSNKTVPYQKTKEISELFLTTLPMTDQVSAPCKSFSFEIKCISQIRNYLSLDVTVILLVSLVFYKLD